MEKLISIFQRSENAHSYGCEYYDLDYSSIAYESDEEVENYMRSMGKTKKLIPCRRYEYENDGSVISQVGISHTKKILVPTKINLH